jgi:hypothetical protein
MKGFSIIIVYSTWTEKHRHVHMSSHEPKVLLEKTNKVPFGPKLKFYHHQMSIFCWCILNWSAMKLVAPIVALILEPCTLNVDVHNFFCKLLCVRFFRELLVVFEVYSLVCTWQKALRRVYVYLKFKTLYPYQCFEELSCFFMYIQVVWTLIW